MSMAPLSTTGWLACKTEHEEWKESNSDCFHCQQSHAEQEHFGYANIEDPNKANGTLQNPTTSRNLFDRSRVTAHQRHPLENTEELDQDLIPSANTGSIVTFQHQTVATPMASRSFGPLEASLSVDQSTFESLLDTSDDVTSQEDDDSEGAGSVIRYNLALDRTAESNALPFVLQGCFAWVSRLAFDSLKLTDFAREFVFSHFEDGEQSRWIIALFANAGRKAASAELVDARPSLMLSALQNVVRRRLGAIKSRPKTERAALVKALDCAVETIAMQSYAGCPNDAIILVQEAAPIFRRLCPEPPDTPINLRTLLQHPLGCLHQYAGIDIILSVLTDAPTLFRYDAAITSSQPFIQDDGIVQWLYGIPDQVIRVFAHMTSMRGNGIIPNDETVSLVERVIHELPLFSGSSSDRFVAIMRSIVQECWRQTALIYLYMAVCGDSSNTLRVKEAVKRFMRLLNGTRPGRLPDEFLTSPLIIISPAAQREHDREVIRQRAMGLHRRGRTFLSNQSVLCIIEDYWAQADAEGRPNMYSDVGVSQRCVLGI